LESINFSATGVLSSHSELFKPEPGTNPFLKPAMVEKVIPAEKKAAGKKATAKPKVKPAEEG